MISSRLSSPTVPGVGRLSGSSGRESKDMASGSYYVVVVVCVTWGKSTGPL